MCFLHLYREFKKLNALKYKHRVDFNISLITDKFVSSVEFCNHGDVDKCESLSENKFDHT